MKKGKFNTIRLTDGNSFEELYNSCFTKLSRFCIKLVGKAEIAEEIVQDQFIRIWEDRNKLEITWSIESYLFTAVKNASLNYLKSVYSRDTVFGHEPDIRSVTQENELEFHELSELIDHSIDNLPEKTAIIFRMSRFGEQTNKEIAAELSVPLKTVEYHITSALKNLRKDVDVYLKS